MDKVVITKAKLDELAQEIAAKSEHPVAMTIDEMSQAVASISPKLENEKTVTPSKNTQTIAPDIYHDGLSSVTVNPIPEQYIIPNLYEHETVWPKKHAQYITPPYTISDEPRVSYQVTEPESLAKDPYGYVIISKHSEEDFVHALGKTMVRGTVTIKATYQSLAATWELTIGDYLITGYNADRGRVIGHGDFCTTNNYTTDDQKIFPDNMLEYVNMRGDTILCSFKDTGYKNSIAYTLENFDLGFYDVDYGSYTGLAPFTVGAVNRLLTITENGTHDVLDYSEVYVNVSTSSTVNNQDKTVTPTTSQQSISADSGYTGLGIVTVNAIPSQYIVPSGNLAITANGTGIDVTQYASVSVDVPVGSTINNQNKTVTPTESQQTITADEGYTGLGTITVNAISSTYVGSGITQRDSDDLTASGATVSVPAGYYSAIASKSIDNASLTFNSITNNEPSVGSTNNKLTLYADIDVRTADDSVGGYVASGQQVLGTVRVYLYSDAPYFNDNSGLTTSGATVTVPAGYYRSSVSKSVASGSATAPTSISGTAASISTGTNTLTLTKTVSVTPTITAGYVSAGTAGNSSVSLTANVTIDPTPTANGATVTIPAGYYTEQTTKSISSGSVAYDNYTVTTAPNITISNSGLITATLNSGAYLTPIVTAGYITSSDITSPFAGVNSTGTYQMTTKAAATITPGTTNQTIAAGTYLTGTQTIAGDADLVGSNILSTANIFGVQGTVDFIDVYIRSAAPTSSVGNDGDIYIQE